MPPTTTTSRSKRQLIDSHIHLLPASAANARNTHWLSSAAKLANTASLLPQYLSAVSRAPVSLDTDDDDEDDNEDDDDEDGDTHTSTNRTLLGAIYIEVDRTLLPGASLAPNMQVSRWKYKFEEVAFLRRAIEGGDVEAVAEATEAADQADIAAVEVAAAKTGKHDTRQGAGADLLLGLVPWAPVDQGPEVLEQYLAQAEDIAGPDVWKRVKGVRFLLQGMRDQSEFEEVVLGERFIEGVKCLADYGEKGWVFDVGVDQRSGGDWQLGGLAHVIRQVREEEGMGAWRQVRFVLNHLCKPSFTQSAFADWRRSMQQLSRFSGVYMKLSGCFSELPASELRTTQEIYTQIRPWIEEIFRLFGPRRVMFGSDWPVCNLNAPGDRGDAWSSWYEICELAIQNLKLNVEEREKFWWRTAKEAYFLEVGDEEEAGQPWAQRVSGL